MIQIVKKFWSEYKNRILSAESLRAHAKQAEVMYWYSKNTNAAEARRTEYLRLIELYEASRTFWMPKFEVRQ